MANPNNYCHFIGKIATDPHFICDKNGNEFAAEFRLKVKRNYKNNGIYCYDDIPIRIEGADIMNTVHNFNTGDTLNLVTAFKISAYKTKEGNIREVQYFLVEALDRIIIEKNEATIKEIKIEAELPV